MGMDMLYHAPEKIGDYALSATDTTAFPAGAPAGLNVTDGGVQSAATSQQVLGLAKTARSIMNQTGPSAGGTQYGSGTIVTGVCVVELFDNSGELADDGSPVAEALSGVDRGDRLYYNTGVARNWTKTQPGAEAPFGLVLVGNENGRLGGIVVYFAFTPRA